MLFCGYLRADTVTIVTIGPFIDKNDFITPQVDITLGGDEAELIKHGSTTVVDISGATWVAVANCRGYYSLTLTASHTDTEGQLTVIVQDDSDCVPVRATFMVVNANVFDSLFAAATTDYLDVNTKTITANAITAVAIADAAIDNATFAADVGSTGYATNIIALAVRKVLDELNLDHLMKIAVVDRDDMTAEVADETVFANLMTKTDGDTSDFDADTDSLEALANASVANLADLINRLDADFLTDTGQVPWEVVKHLKNTPGTEYTRKEIYDSAGQNIENSTTPVAKMVEKI